MNTESLLPAQMTIDLPCLEPTDNRLCGATVSESHWPLVSPRGEPIALRVVFPTNISLPETISAIRQVADKLEAEWQASRGGNVGN